MGRASLLALLLAAGCAHTRPPPSIVGTWRLVEFWNQESPQAARTYEYGEHPTGYLVYDATGHMFVQFLRDPPLAPTDAAHLSKAGAEELAATIDEYVAYFGTYTVDRAAQVVTHHVEGDVRREYSGAAGPTRQGLLRIC